MVVAAPLGVLKAGSIAFKPPLPARKLGAIQRLGFGVLNKVLTLTPALMEWFLLWLHRTAMR